MANFRRPENEVKHGKRGSGEQKTAPAEQTSGWKHADSASQHPSYCQMMFRKILGMYVAKPYSLASCSPVLGKLRFLIFLFLEAAGIAGMLFFGLDSSFPAAFTMRAMTCSFAVLLWGVGIFLFGFLRATVIWPVGIALSTLLSFIRVALQWAYERSPVLLVALGLFLLAVLIGTARFLLKRLVLSFTETFWQYEREGVKRGADLPLGDLPPVRGYTSLLCGQVAVPAGSGRAIRVMLRDYLVNCLWNRLIFCGYEWNSFRGELRLYTYAENAARAKRAFCRFMRRQGTAAVMTCRDDADWEHFRSDIYPNEVEYQQIHNQYLYDRMESAGFDFLQDVPQVYTFYFSEKEDARAFAEQGNVFGYEETRYVERVREVREMGDNLLFSYEVYAQLTGRVGLARMDCNTGRAIEQARRFNGRFYDWEVGYLPSVFEENPATA